MAQRSHGAAEPQRRIERRYSEGARAELGCFEQPIFMRHALINDEPGSDAGSGEQLEQRAAGTTASLRLDVGSPDDCTPLLGFLGDQLAKVGRRASKRFADAG